MRNVTPPEPWLSPGAFRRVLHLIIVLAIMAWIKPYCVALGVWAKDMVLTDPHTEDGSSQPTDQRGN